MLAEYSNAVYEAIGASIPETISIISEWGKKSDCWRKLSSLALDISQIMDYTVPKSVHDDEVKNMRNITAIDNGVEAQTYVINRTSEYWISLYKWILNGNIKASDKELEEFINKNTGKTHEIIVEKHRDKHSGNLKGLTENYLSVQIISDREDLYNTLQKVEVTGYKNGIIYAELSR